MLIDLLQKHDEGDFLRAVAEGVLQMLMEHDVEGVIGAGRYERGEGRQTYRNGYRDRELKTRMGALNLRVPKPHVGEGVGGRHSRGMDRRRLDAEGRRSGAGHGAVGHFQEHSFQALQGHRRAGA